MTKWACQLCTTPDGRDLFTSVRKTVVRRHLIEQHSGVSHRCDSCYKFVARAGQKHGQCDGSHTTLVVRATGVSGDTAQRVLDEFVKDADGKISPRLVSRSVSEGRPQPSAVKRASSLPPPSQPKRWHRSPLERVEPPVSPRFTIKRAGATITAITSADTSPAIRQSSRSKGEKEPAASVSGETAVPSSVVSDPDEAQPSEQMSLAIGPQETLEVVKLPSPPKRLLERQPKIAEVGLDVPTAENRDLVGPSGDLGESVRRVVCEDSQSLTNIKLAAWSDAQSGRLVLDVGGTKFITSKITLRADPTSLLAAMVEKGSTMKPFRKDEYGCPIYYLDRDPAHFRQILNYLRLGNSWSPQSLPREIRYLHDLRAEADHYEIRGLVSSIKKRLTVLQETLYD